MRQSDFSSTGDDATILHSRYCPQGYTRQQVQELKQAKKAREEELMKLSQKHERLKDEATQKQRKTEEVKAAFESQMTNIKHELNILRKERDQLGKKNEALVKENQRLIRRQKEALHQQPNREQKENMSENSIYREEQVCMNQDCVHARNLNSSFEQESHFLKQAFLNVHQQYFFGITKKWEVQDYNKWQHSLAKQVDEFRNKLSGKFSSLTVYEIQKHLDSFQARIKDAKSYENDPKSVRTLKEIKAKLSQAKEIPYMELRYGGDEAEILKERMHEAREIFKSIMNE